MWSAAVEAGGREASDFILHRIALRKIHRQTGRFFLPSTATLPLSGQSCPVFCRSLNQDSNCCDTRGGGQGRGKDEDNHTRETTDSQSAIDFYVRGWGVSADQQVRNCKQVSFGQTARPVARPKSFGPPLQTRRFPSFPVVARSFSSFLVVSRAFRIRSASNAGFEPPQSCKARSDPGRNFSKTGTTTREG